MLRYCTARNITSHQATARHGTRSLAVYLGAERAELLDERHGRADVTDRIDIKENDVRRTCGHAAARREVALVLRLEKATRRMPCPLATTPFLILVTC